MDRRTLLVVLPLACAPSQPRAPARETVDEPVEVVVVEVDAGTVRVEGADTPRVTIGHDGRALLELVDGVLTVEGRCDTLLPCDLDLTVTVPAGVDVRVRSGGGDVWLRDLAGDVRVEVADGDVVGRGLRSPSVRVQAAWGGAELAFAEAPEQVTASVGVGDVALTVPAGAYALDLQALGAPDVRGVADDPAGPRLYARTSSGRIRVTAIE